MATNTFGRRGVVAPASRASFQSAAASASPAVMRDDDEPSSHEGSIFGDNKLLADIPFLTLGLIFGLMVIFALQRSLAVDIARDGSLDVRSLIAQGASGYDLVVGRNEWWRIGLAPLLHGSQWHLIGNCVALFIVGVRVESLIGRGWFSLIFVASAVAGEAASLLGNGSGTVGVGASGAITGLIAALFVASFEPEADAETTISRLKTSLFFGIPALLPLAFGASGNVNYYAHGGGALAGAALAITPWLAFWSYDSLPRSAGLVLLGGLVGSLVCAGFAAAHYRSYMADAGQYIRASEMPTSTREMASRSSDFVNRYPKDARAHLFRAIYFIEQNNPGPAETEVQTAMSLAASDVTGGPVRAAAQALLANLLLARGRTSEAKAMAAEVCRAKLGDLRRMLEKSKLCS
ncbi:rhomboid family intramembrane serine protease [Bradyrhizobium sp. INPA01-394B]|uniref:Rhomboid family intramembrane serine protease n=1 Tax=Bradyrhizobium campsiandrae TaxID=1729892 RepID=A0ABR7UDZ8_9BRAD|nr:rhomboid family intramembrane serine protease [Bradyrhizobium campsiandrae]MBC9875775.1 rhomboid family intramembrane serine protease [Bradyrhizobium campsiandrae]MBC9981662.1 rhomboid family intramembrane serine protease [Bradyrhizobium campsiandrae]